MATPGAWNIHPYLENSLTTLKHSFSEPFEGDTVSKESSSGTGHCDVFDNWSSWSKGRGFKGGNNYNERAGPLNNGSRYSSPYGAQAPSTIEGHILQFPVLPPSQFRNHYSRPPLTPTYSQNNIQVRIAFSNPVCMLIHVGSNR